MQEKLLRAVLAKTTAALAHFNLSLPSQDIVWVEIRKLSRTYLVETYPYSLQGNLLYLNNIILTFYFLYVIFKNYVIWKLTEQINIFHNVLINIEVDVRSKCQRFRSSRSQMFFKIGVLRNFANFTGKHLC